MYVHVQEAYTIFHQYHVSVFNLFKQETNTHSVYMLENECQNQGKVT